MLVRRRSLSPSVEPLSGVVKHRGHGGDAAWQLPSGHAWVLGPRPAESRAEWPSGAELGAARRRGRSGLCRAERRLGAVPSAEAFVLAAASGVMAAWLSASLLYAFLFL